MHDCGIKIDDAGRDIRAGGGEVVYGGFSEGLVYWCEDAWSSFAGVRVRAKKYSVESSKPVKFPRGVTRPAAAIYQSNASLSCWESEPYHWR